MVNLIPPALHQPFSVLRALTGRVLDHTEQSLTPHERCSRQLLWPIAELQ